MLKIVGNSEDKLGQTIAHWYSQKTEAPVFGPYAAIAFLNEDQDISGAAILNSYNGANININFYGPRCITRSNFRFVLSYVFNEIGCVRLTALPPRNNKKILRALPRLNFSYETVLKHYYGNKKQDDAIVYRMTPLEASKWIKTNGTK